MDASTDERDLVRAAATGDPDAWDRLVGRFGALVWSIVRAYGLSPDDGANAAHTTWLRLAEELGRPTGRQGRLGVWLAATAREESLRLLGAAGAAGSEPAVPLGGGEAGGARRDALLWRVVHELPERCRRLLRILMSVPAPSVEEVAAALDLPVARVAPARVDCLREFRRRMAGIGIRAEPADS